MKKQEDFTSSLDAGIQSALRLAIDQRAPELFTVHVLTALSTQSDTTFVELLRKSGVDIPAFHAFLANRSTLLPKLASIPATMRPSNELVETLKAAKEEAIVFGDRAIDTDHVLLASLKHRPAKELWQMFDLSYDKVAKHRTAQNT